MLVVAGHDVSTVVLQQMESKPDIEIIQACRAEGRALVTMDLDFANPLDYPPSQYHGIAVLRLPGKATSEDLVQTIETLVKGLQQNQLAGQLWIVEKGRIRVYQQPDE